MPNIKTHPPNRFSGIANGPAPIGPAVADSRGADPSLLQPRDFVARFLVSAFGVDAPLPTLLVMADDIIESHPNVAVCAGVCAEIDARLRTQARKDPQLASRLSQWRAEDARWMARIAARAREIGATQRLQTYATTIQEKTKGQGQ